MARINIEDSLFKDQRFIELAIATGSMRNALGALMLVWIQAQKWWALGQQGIPREEWVKHRLAQEVIDCGLAVEEEGAIRARGCREQFAWLFSQVEKSRKGGLASAEARKKKFGTAQPPQHDTEPGPNHRFDTHRTTGSVGSNLPNPHSHSQTHSQLLFQTEEEEPSLRSGSLPQRPAARSGALPVFANDRVCVELLETVAGRAQEAWLKSYPDAEWLGAEMRKAYSWIESNPKRAPKQVAKFLANWFSRAYEAHRKGQAVNSTHSTRNAEVLKNMAQRVKDGEL